MLVTEDLDMRLWIRIAKRLERWQGENEIANRAAADNEEAFQFLISRKRKREDDNAVTESDPVQKAPLGGVPGAPVDLVAQ